MPRRIPRSIAAATAVLCAAVLFATMASAATPEREAYVAQVEPICKTNTKANERILGGVRQQIKQGKLDLAAGKFLRAATAFGKAVRQIRAVPQPAADAAKLTKWLRALKTEQELLRKIGKALRERNKVQAQTNSVRLSNNGNIANNLVLGFGFDYCLIKQSRFS